MLCLVAQWCLTLCDPMGCSPPGSSVHGDSPVKNTRVGCHALLQGLFPTQGSKPGVPCCRQILYHLSHQGSPRILQWVAYSFSRGSSQPRNQLGISAFQVNSLLAELPGKLQYLYACVLSCFSCVQLFATLWTIACQAPLSMEILQARILEWVAMPSSRGSS